MSRQIIHLHIPAFSIAVARVCQPALRDRPVVVAPLQSERALILSASPEARKEGLFKGMPLSRAKSTCPDLTVLPPDPGLTDRACQGLARVVARYTPLWEPSRPGHIFLDLTGTGRLWGKAKDMGNRLRREIEGSLCLSGSVGVACNKMVSSIASQIMPSQGILDVDHGKEASFMAPLTVNLVPGIGRFRKRILLEELNISRVRELAALDMVRMKLIFGRQAYVIHQRAIGIDPTPVSPSPTKSVVTEEITLEQDENDDSRLLGAIYRLVEKCAYRLRARALFPQKAGLIIRYSDQVETKSQAMLLPMSTCTDPQAGLLTCWGCDLYRSIKELFFKACTRRTRVRFIRVWFRDLYSSSGQLSLFPTPSPAQEKSALVTGALDRIRERYGYEAIIYGRAAS